ncbi:bifunctional diaminohydroxyphosphoribosylaminopyrimidine deaminase/5-amino-6-(5-phosphoribosylamino)uracil reductase RibD [Leptospira bouyouniensis]|uniref:bifunctional diaminohydroxyphosphoribosylaminopyrimidine deaminase/5-amino-6-(5-phosphoribosylamino)uracil reductase RibD n=1 Tax=Leptospira bouyouniensis TaxID=2484911 RepID=UPI0010914BA6|nr:deaminase [Leptospira bouyouniensis]TGM80372.1 deaminase [Leptospira bouyouniensis]
MNVEKRKELYSLHSLLGFLAMGKTGGNPPVSAVLTDLNGNVIEKAHTQEYGGNHAERELFSLLQKQHSLNQIIPKESPLSETNEADTSQKNTNSGVFLSDFILSVSLEPCTHFGKTPPCRDLVLESKPKELLIGWKDPNPLVMSGDWESYQEKCITVRLDPMLANTSIPYLQGFIKRMQTGLPWVWIKSATSKEGNYADSSLKKERVSSVEIDLYLQILRAKFDAVACGPNTIFIDEPSLHFRITEEMIRLAGLPKRETELIPFFEAATNLFTSLTKWARDTTLLHQLEEGKYQPYRVFVLDPKRLPSENFFSKQMELNDRYGEKKCIFFVIVDTINVEAEIFDLPFEIRNQMETLSLHPIFPIGKNDGDLFLKTLGKFGINSLLCEAGSFFPNFLNENLSDEDCILEIRNFEKSIPHGIPFVYQNEHILSEFKIGSNSVFIRKPKRST